MKKLEYIGTQGGVWFDLGIADNTTGRIFADYIISQQQTNYGYFDIIGQSNNWSVGITGSKAHDAIYYYCNGRESGIYNGNNQDCTIDITISNVIFDNKTTGYQSNFTTKHTFSGNVFMFSNGLLTGACREVIFYNTSDNIVKDWIPVIDDNDVVCFYDKVGHTYSYNAGTGTTIAGPVLTTIDVATDKLTYPASGGVATITIDSETNWTVTSSENWATLSATAGTSADTAITVTFPSYTGDTKRSVTLTFTNAEDTIDLTLYQKKYSAGVASEVYIAETNITELYLGDTQIENIYIGETEVYSSGPFIGLRCSPKTMELTNMTKSGNIVVRSSEDWTISTDAQWLTLSVTGGTTGKTSLVATATDTESERTATITVSSATYSATCVVTQKQYSVPFNEIWVSTIDNTLSNLTLDNNKYFIDTDGNKMTTYTKQFDSTNSRWVITFPNNVAGQRGIVWGTRSTYKFVNMWFPATFINPASDFLYYYTSSGAGNIKAFLGDSPCIAANGRILVNKDSASSEYNYVVCCTHDVSTPLVIPEGVVGCSNGYTFINTTFTEITFPTTLAYFSTYYQFEACSVNTINFLATTAPTGTKRGSFTYWPTNVTVHYPTGSAYSGVQAICPPQWTWVGDL